MAKRNSSVKAELFLLSHTEKIFHFYKSDNLDF